MSDQLLLAKSAIEIGILPRMANRHGLITGATGTGKTVSLQVMAERFSSIGVPVFLADVKGDLAGLSRPGGDKPKVAERVTQLGLNTHAYRAYPIELWDSFGELGNPLRATISDMGPLLISRLLNLNETQTGVLYIVFKIADDEGLLLLDLRDLRSMVQFVGENAKSFTTSYGNISTASIGSIQRNLLTLEEEGADRFFGEPSLNIDDLLQTDAKGRGVINILAAEKLFHSPRAYACSLLWLLSELFEQLPETGDVEKPKLLFFFDEAHLLFEDIPDALLEKIEQVVRLIRSKGVGVYFVTQNPLDIPDKVLAQLGNRIQHALRAFTPKEQKAVRSAAETFRANPAFSVEEAITQLGIGEALVSFLDEKGSPRIVERALIIPPESRIGALSADERREILYASTLRAHYGAATDRESAHELLRSRAEKRVELAQAQDRQDQDAREPARARRGRPADSIGAALAKSAARAVGSQIGRQVVRGILGSLFGGKR